jgi:hypothetical protein
VELLVQFQAMPVIAISTSAAQANHFFIRTLLVLRLAIHGDDMSCLHSIVLGASSVPAAEKRREASPDRLKARCGEKLSSFQ